MMIRYSFMTLAAVIAMPAMAVTTIFVGQDDGAAVGGPFPNSTAAESAFVAAASVYGAVKTETLEGATVGDLAVVALDDFTITSDVSNLGAGFSGINDTTISNLYGFNTTVGGEKWYGFPSFEASGASFGFNRPTNSVGLWITGIQADLTAELLVELVDGSMESFSLPLNGAGGAQFYGVVSDIAFSFVEVRQINNPGFSDAFGIDDISYNAVPEPATWALMISGFGLVGFAARRRRSSKTVAHSQA